MIGQLYCGKCLQPTDICYTDGGALAMVHGQCLCRSCYIADGHPECPQCKELTYKGFRFCPWCGSSLAADPDYTLVESREPAMQRLLQSAAKLVAEEWDGTSQDSEGQCWLRTYARLITPDHAEGVSEELR